MPAERRPRPQLLHTLAGDRQPVVSALLLMMEAKHAPSRYHMENVGLYTGLLARQLGLPQSQVEMAQLAGLLHDLGKVSIPDAILTKAAPLDAGEIRTMMRHAEIGGALLSGIEGLAALAVPVRHHHEWVDGRGYPDGIKGSQIPLLATLVSVADAFDTMTTPRPFRRPLAVPDALQEIRRCAGTQFDPAVADAFTDLVDDAWRQRAEWLCSLVSQEVGAAVNEFEPLVRRLESKSEESKARGA